MNWNVPLPLAHPGSVAFLCLALTMGIAATAAGQPRRPGAAQQPPPVVAEPPPPPPEDPAKVDPAMQQPVRDLFEVSPQPLGHAGRSQFRPLRLDGDLDLRAVPMPDRWRVGWPAWDRYGRQAPGDGLLMNHRGGDSPYVHGHPLNPFDQNVLKGDYPIHRTEAGDDIFLRVTGVSDTFAQYRRLPTPSGVSAQDPNSFSFFGRGEQIFLFQTVLLDIELFQGYTTFRPVDWLVRVAPVYNFNYLELKERNVTNINPRAGRTRRDEFATLNEAFFEYHLGDTSHYFDIMAVRAGRQLFISDFRGFVYSDLSDGVRLLGNAASNRIQYNLAVFNQNLKDTNSELPRLDWRDQQVLIANMYVQDFIWLGYTTQFSFHWNRDRSDEHYNENGFLVIPSQIGTPRPHKIDAYYLGWAGDGHIGRLNVNHAFYYVLGKDSRNPLAGRPVDISAFMGAIELSIDFDWLRPKVSFMYASGDSRPEDGTARGFDGIIDNPFFAGGPSSFYQAVGLPLFGVNLVSPRSFYNDLAGNKVEGQANYVNPGTILANVGLDAELTPKLRTSINANSIWFAQTEPLELFLNQNSINPHVGYELNLLGQYRPLLNNNVIFTTGASAFFPGSGFRDIFEDRKQLFQVFTALTLQF
jgi:hypothetical protein